MVGPREQVRRKRLAVAYADRHHIPHPGVRFVPGAGRSWIALRTILNKKAGRPGNPPLTDRLSPAALAMIENDDPTSKLKSKATRDRQAALRAAVSQIGVSENPAGSNDGPKVHVYESTTGAYGQPWCGSFQTWCWREAGVALSGFNTAYCPSWVAAAHAGQHGLRVVSHSEAEAGDLALYDWQRDGVSDHIGIVESVQAGGHTAIEGNTSTTVVGSQSNGGCVARRDRSLADVSCYIRVAVA